ncbi:MAG: maltose ABC transporter substrate-binding protein [Treponema sp.]|jgi:arabinogalactan oligomer/maltooligosaccharide transport system substrate-binding protein|nr:maltose ABC transporter substrate-binding protein [Treponema sp.]
MKKLVPVVVGIGAVLILTLTVFIISALITNGAMRTATAQLIAEKEAEGHITGELLVWLDNNEWAHAVIAAFEKHYPNVHVKYENIGNVDSRGKVSLDGPAGIGPDVFMMPHDHIINAVIDGICLPFPPEDKEKYSGLVLEASIRTCIFYDDFYKEDMLFAIPISTENIAFFYNRDLLGNSPVPQTFEEIISFAERNNSSTDFRFALRWQVDDSYHNYFFLTAFGMQLFGPDMNDFTQPGFDSEGAKQGIEFHNSLRNIYNVNTADATWDSTVAAFQRGEVPFTITGPWAIGDALRNGINFGVTRLPTIAGNQPRCFSGNIVAAVSSYSRNIPAARAFIDFLVSEEGMTIQFEQTGKLASLKDISRIEGLRDNPHLMGIMEQAPFADPMPVIPEVNQMWDALKALFTFTWDRQLSVEEAQEKAMETYDIALQMAGKSRFETTNEEHSTSSFRYLIPIVILLALLVFILISVKKRSRK